MPQKFKQHPSFALEVFDCSVIQILIIICIVKKPLRYLKKVLKTPKPNKKDLKNRPKLAMTYEMIKNVFTNRGKNANTYKCSISEVRAIFKSSVSGLSVTD